jgi:hypothetical protein
MKKIDLVLAFVAVACCVVFWILYSLATHELFPGSLYYLVMIAGVGGLIWKNHRILNEKLGSWKLNPLLKFLILGYGMVLFEEVFAALANNFAEGFSFPVFILRVGQFWAFNLLAFTGFVFGWYLLLKYVGFTKREIFYLSGVWGLYAEHFHLLFLANPTAAAVLALPTMFVYGVIVTPAMFSVEKMGEKIIRPSLLKYTLALAVIFVCSIIPVLALLYLRTHYPFVFPPTNLIQ